MTLRNLFIVNAVIALFFGLSFVLAPALTLSLYGVTVSAAGILLARLLGATLLGICVFTWFTKDPEDSKAQRGIVLGQLVHTAIGFIVLLLGQLAGVVNPLGWSTVAIYLLLALGYGYFQFVKPTAS